MEQKNRYRIVVWAILLLVILNVALIGLLWYEHTHRPQLPPTLSKNEREARFAAELGLNKQQADSVRLLRDQHFRTKDSIVFEISRLSRHMIEEVFAPTPDTALVRQLSDRIGQNQTELEREVYNHFNLIRELCQPAQYENLKRLIIDAIRSKQPPPMGGHHRPPPPGDHRPPPPRDDFRYQIKDTLKSQHGN